GRASNLATCSGVTRYCARPDVWFATFTATNSPRRIHISTLSGPTRQRAHRSATLKPSRWCAAVITSRIAAMSSPKLALAGVLARGMRHPPHIGHLGDDAEPLRDEASDTGRIWRRRAALALAIVQQHDEPPERVVGQISG